VRLQFFFISLTISLANFRSAFASEKLIPRPSRSSFLRGFAFLKPAGTSPSGKEQYGLLVLRAFSISLNRRVHSELAFSGNIFSHLNQYYYYIPEAF
jgi:hypothetical protein